DPQEILNGDQGPDESLVLAGEMDRIENAIAAIAADLDAHGESPTLYRRLREKEAEKAALAPRLAEAKQKASHPLSASWGEAQSLLSVMDSAPDPQDSRLRLRSLLRRMIDSIWLLVVPRGHDRLAAVQIWFAGGKRCRSYLMLHKPPKANKYARQEGGWW